MTATLGQRLHAARYAKGYKLATVRKLAGISVSFLSDMERDVTRPALSTLQKLAACYGVTMGSLLGEGEAPVMTTTGRLAVLKRVLLAHADDLSLPGSTDAEREVSAVLNALSTAILLERTSELAAVTHGWIMGLLCEAVLGMAADDQSREDAIAALRVDGHEVSG